MGNPMFELMRHDVTFPLYVEVDQIYNLACPASPDPLPVRPGADDQDQRARGDQHAGPGQAGEGARSCRPRPARSTATPRSTRRPRTTGATSTRSGPAPATTRASAARRRCSSTTTASTASTSRWSRIFNTYGPRMHPNDGRVVSQLHRPGAARRADHDLRRRRADPVVLLRRRPGRRHGAAHGHPARLHRAGQPRQPGRVHACCELADSVIELTGSRSSSIGSRPLPLRRPDSNASPTSRSPAPSSAGSRASSSPRG